MQTELFDQEKPSSKEATKELVISVPAGKTLSKQQQKFNKLVKKIKQLREDLVFEKEQLNDNLAFYGEKIHPLKKEVNQLRSRLVILTYPFLKNRKFAGKDRDFLRHLLSGHLDAIFQFEQKPSDELKKIFEEVNGISFEEAKKNSMDEMLEEMQDMMDDMGFDVELNPNDFDDSLSNEELIVKMKEMQEKMQSHLEENEAEKATRKKTPKQLEKEEKEKQKEELRKKSINSIYRQLAKILHPDLEQDPEIKADKESRMQQLTAAYEAGDLHTLLSLELEWITKEGDDIARLTNEKLDIYNSLLKEQIEELEMEINMASGHARFNPIRHYFDHFGNIDINKVHFYLKDQKKELGSLVKVMGSPGAEREIKALLKEFRNASDPFFDLK